MKTQELQQTTAEIRLTAEVERSIRATIGSLPAETGGMLGGNIKDGLITKYYFDKTADMTGATYSPNVDILNQIRRERWKPNHLDMLGFVHSHPPGCIHPSPGDLTYAMNILKALRRDQLVLLIVQSKADCSEYRLLAYVARLEDDSVRVDDARLVVEKTMIVAAQEEWIDACTTAGKSNGAAHPMPADVLVAGRAVGPEDIVAMADRVKDAYVLPLMMMCRLIVVGVGGAREWVLNMARAMAMEFILIDPDDVALPNLCTQHCYRDEIGRPKVEALAEEIRSINPRARIIARHQALDEIDDAEFSRLAFDPMLEVPLPAWGVGVRIPVAPRFVLLCGCTDNFEAQARVNRLGLNLGIPTLCAQVYQEGLCGEITFADLRTTVACHRCILRPRYEAYLNDGYRNMVTSQGTPIWSTARLNSLKGMVAMSMIHHGTDHSRWGSLLRQIGNRNLVQIRMAPDLSPLGIGSFDRVFAAADQSRLLMDEAIWLPQLPEDGSKGRPRCPECGGTGNLRDAIGKFKDTRTMPPYETR
ncbi:MAG: ThiF family adenylyltransferase [Phycisphaerae bacterium]|jgi:molybdopterin/thiamine biosynthesis adenylyltransferase